MPSSAAAGTAAPTFTATSETTGTDRAQKKPCRDSLKMSPCGLFENVPF
jgi:hypothetical protein